MVGELVVPPSCLPPSPTPTPSQIDSGKCTERPHADEPGAVNDPPQGTTGPTMQLGACGYTLEDNPHNGTYLTGVQASVIGEKCIVSAMVLPVNIPKPTAPLVAMVDSGAPACLISATAAQMAGLAIQPLPRLVPVTTLGSSNTSKNAPMVGRLAGRARAVVALPGNDLQCGHCMEMNLFVWETDFLPRWPLILGLDWLRLACPTIDWGSLGFAFDQGCSGVCGAAPPSVDAASLAGAPVLSAERNDAWIDDLDEGLSDGAAATALDGGVSGSLPEHLHDFADVFDPKAASTLPPHRDFDCPIDLVGNAGLPFQPIYPLSPAEADELRTTLDENLARGFIRRSRSAAGAPILFVPKKDGARRMCVDYRRLNEITKKDRDPLPLIPQMLDQLARAEYMTALDLCNAYNRIRIRAGDEHKTAFRTRFGTFEYLVMPFGLANAPAVFQRFMNHLFHDLLDRGVLVYLDDILIYADSKEEHDRLVRVVLERLRENELYCKLAKCVFGARKMAWLGHCVSSRGISMDPNKTAAVRDWPVPKTLNELQQFLGFCNYYRGFIARFGEIARPLHDLTKPPPGISKMAKSTPLAWGPKQQRAFDTLKAAFAVGEGKVLAHADPTRQFMLETDASGAALGAVLGQKDDAGHVRPVAFYSRSFNPAERNYDVYERELLAIVDAFRAWRHHLEGAAHKVLVHTDHKNLEGFRAATTTSARLSRWRKILEPYDYEFRYIKGDRNGRADALSRRPDYEGADEPERGLPVLKADALLAGSTETSAATGLLPAMETAALVATAPPAEIMSDIATASAVDEFVAAARDGDGPAGVVWDGQWLRRGKAVYVPTPELRTRALQLAHDVWTAGHGGRRKTQARLSRAFWWPGAGRDVADYVKTCEPCARAKALRQAPRGLLQPLPTPARPFASISLDFITDLPPSNGFTCIMVVVCRLSKMVRLVPLPALPSSAETADALLHHVVRSFGLPEDIVSDRGSQFTSSFWSALMAALKIKHKPSTAFHPQTDGQTERMNQTVEGWWRVYLDYQTDDWAGALTFTELSINSNVNDSTGMTPFCAVLGFEPRVGAEPALAPPSAANVQVTAGRMAEVHHGLRARLDQAKALYKKHADARRTEAPQYKVGDKVLVSLMDSTAFQKARKFRKRYSAPVTITRVIPRGAVEVELPPQLSSRTHNVFNVSKVKPFATSDPARFPGRAQPLPEPANVDGEDWFLVRRVLDMRKSNHRTPRFSYLVDWEGYDISDASWQPLANLTAGEVCNEQLIAFHRANPTLPRPAVVDAFLRGREVVSRLHHDHSADHVDAALRPRLITSHVAASVPLCT